MKRLMIYTNKRSINLNGVSDFLKKYSNVLMLFSIFCCGLIFGSIFAIKGHTETELFRFENTEGNLFVSVFVGNLIVISSLLILSIFFGFSSIGVPFICIIPLIYGIICGLTAGQCLKNDSLAGIGIYILVYLFGQVLAFSGILLSSYFSLNYSYGLALTAFAKKQHKNDTVMFLLRSFFCFPVCFVAAIISAVCNILFNNFL